MSLPVPCFFRAKTMRKTFIFILSFIILTVVSCSEKQERDVAARMAKEYYDSLFAGNAAYFVAGTYLPDTVPDSYSEQLEANAKMFVARMNDEHHGVKEVRVLNCVNDTIVSKDKRSSAYVADAYLVLCFGDSLNEEIVVRMIENNGRWLMK